MMLSASLLLSTITRFKQRYTKYILADELRDMSQPFFFWRANRHVIGERTDMPFCATIAHTSKLPRQLTLLGVLRAFF